MNSGKSDLPMAAAMVLEDQVFVHGWYNAAWTWATAQGLQRDQWHHVAKDQHSAIKGVGAHARFVCVYGWTWELAQAAQERGFRVEYSDDAY